MSTHEPPAAFSWLNLRAELTGKQARVLIDGASGTARRGRVLAIIGPSGAGKSTLLQALAGRLDRSSKLRLSGTLAPPPSRPGAFVYQEDAFFSRLTVAETLRFAAALRAAQSTSVADVLAAMGLAEVASSAVGGGKVRGISGGERKRLAIGCALLAVDGRAPLFADEPTSGLDSFQARRIVEAIGRSARGGDGRAVLLSAPLPTAPLPLPLPPLSPPHAATRRTSRLRASSSALTTSSSSVPPAAPSSWARPPSCFPPSSGRPAPRSRPSSGSCERRLFTPAAVNRRRAAAPPPAAVNGVSSHLQL